jgi:hypothetical protein
MGEFDSITDRRAMVALVTHDQHRAVVGDDFEYRDGPIIDCWA